MSQPRALALIGGDHDPDTIRKGLGPAFEAVGASVEFTEELTRLSAHDLADVGLFVLFRNGRAYPKGHPKFPGLWMSAAQESTLAEHVSAGGGLLIMHQGAADQPGAGPFRELLGGEWNGHPPMTTFDVRVIDKAHPVTKGVEDYVVTDEQHFLEHDPDGVTLLTKSYSGDGESPSCWIKQYGSGRVCLLANGHNIETLAHPQFQRLLRNAIAWCLSV